MTNLDPKAKPVAPRHKHRATDIVGLPAADVDVPADIPFTYAGAIAISTSPPWVSRVGATVVSAIALLGTAGTSSTVVTVYVNGVSVGTVTLTSGQTNVGASLTSTALAADTDLVTVGVTTVGTGAKDLDVLVRVA